MSERIIEPKNYTLEILGRIEVIKNRMRNTLIQFTDQDIIVVEYEGIIYILANPVLGEEPIFDEFGQFERMTPMHNITLIQDTDKPTTKNNWADSGRFLMTNDEIKYTFTIKKPRLLILRPDLCDRILSND